MDWICRFGDVWAEAMKRLRDEKLEGKGGKRLEFIEEGKPLCDVCGEAVGRVVMRDKRLTSDPIARN